MTRRRRLLDAVQVAGCFVGVFVIVCLLAIGWGWQQ